MTNKNKKQLKALASRDKLRYQIGKDSIDEEVLLMLENAIKARELIKVYFNKNIIDKMEALTDIIIKKLNAELIGTIGHTIILYRENKEKKNRIILN